MFFDYNSKEVAHQCVVDYKAERMGKLREFTAGETGHPGPVGPRGGYSYTQRKEKGCIGRPLEICACYNEERGYYECWQMDDEWGRETIFILPKAIFIRLFRYSADTPKVWDGKETDV